ncbi:eotaxin-like [Tachysurus fulvidraco]|uniref:eotaxin-like n=1 Tax=Tachysurus fulvidraco TaxID=1234273 RepID=UPI000F50A48E|nr:eotaxin-like [Tachysurus fulvidraco]
MLARSLLVIMLVLTCHQYFTMAQSAKGPEDCCFKFFIKPIPVRVIKTYINTSSDCPKNGVIFTTQNSSRVCVDPGFKWVQRAMDLVDQRLYESST